MRSNGWKIEAEANDAKGRIKSARRGAVDDWAIRPARLPDFYIEGEHVVFTADYHRRKRLLLRQRLPTLPVRFAGTRIGWASTRTDCAARIACARFACVFDGRSSPEDRAMICASRSGATGRECREDGADDRCLLTNLGVCVASAASADRGTVSPARAHQEGVTKTSVSVEMGAPKTVPPASIRGMTPFSSNQTAFRRLAPRNPPS